MDEDLFKRHKELKIPEITLFQTENKKQNTFSEKFELRFSKDNNNSLFKAHKNRQNETTIKVLQNYEYKTNILSNISLENNISSSLLSNVFHYSVSSDWLSQMSRTNKCDIRNRKNDNIYPRIKKKVLLNDKCDIYSTENNHLGKVTNKTVCDFRESYLSKRQSSLKRKFESADVMNELNLRLAIRENSRSATFTERFGSALSYPKHFKADFESEQMYEKRNKHFFYQSQFVNQIGSMKDFSFKQMKNIEIQSSPMKIRVAANFGEDSVEYVDPTMEVELDSEESDPDDPIEADNQDITVEPFQQNETAEGTDEFNSEAIVNTLEINSGNNEAEDNSPKEDSDNVDNTNVVEDEKSCLSSEQCSDQDACKNIASNQTSSVEKETEDTEKVIEDKSENDLDYEENLAKAKLTHLDDLEKDISKANIEAQNDTPEFHQSENIGTIPDKADEKLTYDRSLPEDDRHSILKSDVNQTNCITNDEAELSKDNPMKSSKDSEHEKFVEITEDEEQIQIQEICQSENNSSEKKDLFEDIKSEETRDKEISETKDVLNESQSMKEMEEESFKKLSEQTTEEFNIHGIDAFCEDEVKESLKEDFSTTEIDDSKQNISQDIIENADEIKDTKEILLNEQENILERNCKSYVNEEENDEKDITKNEITDNKSMEESNIDEELSDHSKSSEKRINEDENHHIMAKDFEHITQGSEFVHDYEKISEENATKLENEDISKETVVSREIPENVKNEIPKNNDIEDTEAISDIAYSDVSLKGIENYNENIKLSKESEVNEEQTEIHSIELRENKENQIDELKNIDSKDNIYEEQSSFENSLHQSIENDEDSLEKDSIEDADNFENIEKVEIEPEEICSNSVKDNLQKELEESSNKDKQEYLEIVSNDFEEESIEEEIVSVKENINSQNLQNISIDDKPIFSENGIVNEENIYEKIEENSAKKEVLNYVINGLGDTALKSEDENIANNRIETKTDDLKEDDEAMLESEKCDGNVVCDVSENLTNDSENARKDITENKMHSKENEVYVDNINEHFCQDKESENEFAEQGEIETLAEEERNENFDDEKDTDGKKSSFTESLPGTETKILTNGNDIEMCNEKKIVDCSASKSESATSQKGENVCVKAIHQTTKRSSEKQKDDKPEQSSADSTKVISPRKGIKVEEDEIETAIRSIEFYDEMSDGNEQIVQTVLFPKPSIESENIQSNNILTDEKDSEMVTERKVYEITQTNLNEELPLQGTGEDEKVEPDEAKLQPSTSPKKRKKKRKISRSRSAQKGGLVPRNQ